MNLLETIKTLNETVSGSYPNSYFYEADTVMCETDNGEFGPDVDPVSTKLMWGTTDGKTVIVSFDKEGTPDITLVNEPWLEDQPMTPYISMDVAVAQEMLQKVNAIITSPMLTLRHSLVPGCIEPHYYFKSKNSFISVGVYSGDVKTVE